MVHIRTENLPACRQRRCPLVRPPPAEISCVVWVLSDFVCGPQLFPKQPQQQQQLLSFGTWAGPLAGTPSLAVAQGVGVEEFVDLVENGALQEILLVDFWEEP